MSIRPSEEVLKAVERLVASSADFRAVVDWLEKEAGSEIEQLLSLPNPVLVHQSQGRAACLLDLIHAFGRNPRLLPSLG